MLVMKVSVNYESSFMNVVLESSYSLVFKTVAILTLDKHFYETSSLLQRLCHDFVLLVGIYFHFFALKFSEGRRGIVCGNFFIYILALL